ncbi:type II toxin-antitoxin system RelE/ParE family toxin [Mesorhizobium microcysteis]|uniref:Toxin n=1 Tax=Neoaquamicrobium microcysteis TaxID=2682781 RepID=A0A5D4GQ48_9HYPH|nr:type II toxin-antitoxin system RelE/ParE family toxin [Mesorhizobium microcysteis]TYR30294.1 type II toxin-antitoxin system RelE/ParE family toxin [Mesorhizobium microcysteis]
MRRYRLSPAARADLSSIWDYTADRWSVDQADRYTRELIDAVNDLCSGTSKGRRIDQVRSNYLALPAGAHLIVFRHSPTTIDVIRILHRRMDMTAHLES